MKKKISLVAVFIILTASFLLSCGKKESITGEWTNESGNKYVFNDDGTGMVSVSGYSVKSTYMVNDNKVVITTVLLGQEQREEYSYELNDGKLKLTQPGVEIELNKN